MRKKNRFRGLMGNQLERNKFMVDRLRKIADGLERSELLARQEVSMAGLIEATRPGDTDESWIVAGIYREHVEFSDLDEIHEVPQDLVKGPVCWDSEFPETELMVEPQEHRTE